jgi:hypothetical protein
MCVSNYVTPWPLWNFQLGNHVLSVAMAWMKPDENISEIIPVRFFLRLELICNFLFVLNLSIAIGIAVAEETNGHHNTDTTYLCSVNMKTFRPIIGIRETVASNLLFMRKMTQVFQLSLVKSTLGNGPELLRRQRM